MTFSEELQNKFKERYRNNTLNEKQLNFLDKAIQQKQITITEEDEIVRQETIKSTIPELMPIEYGDPVEPLSGKESLKAAKSALKIAPYTLGMVPGAGAPVTAISETGLGLLEGEKPKEALTRGAIAGATELVIPKVVKGGLGIGKTALKTLTKFATKADKNVINKAIKNPELTKIPIKTNLEVAAQIEDYLDIATRKKNRDYKKALEAIPEKEKLKPVDTSNVQKYILQEGVDPQSTIALIETARPKTKIFNLDSLNKFINGQEITFDEAKTINSLLSDLQRSNAIDAVDKRSIQKLKDELYKSLSNVKGFKELNKKYATQTQLIRNIERNLGSKTDGKYEIQETKVNTITNDVLKAIEEKRTTKSKILENLKGLDKEVKARGQRSVVNQLEANAVQDSINKSIKGKENQLFRGLTTIGGYGTLWYQPKLGAAVLATQGAKDILQSEPVAKRILKAAQTPLSPRARRIAKTTTQIAAKPIAQQTGRNVMPIVRDISGKISNQEQIEKERGVVK